MERVLGVRVLGTIPEDPNIRRAASYKTPVVVKFPSSPAAVAFRNLAGEIAGIPMEQRGGTTQEKFIDRFSRVLFRGKNDNRTDIALIFVHCHCYPSHPPLFMYFRIRQLTRDLEVLQSRITISDSELDSLIDNVEEMKKRIKL